MFKDNKLLKIYRIFMMATEICNIDQSAYSLHFRGAACRSTFSIVFVPWIMMQGSGRHISKVLHSNDGVPVIRTTTYTAADITLWLCKPVDLNSITFSAISKHDHPPSFIKRQMKAKIMTRHTLYNIHVIWHPYILYLTIAATNFIMNH